MLPLVPCSERHPRRIPLRLCLLLVTMASLLIPAAYAQTCAVTNTGDSTGPGTLRTCLTSQTSGEQIVFEITGTITLNHALPPITQNMTITGSGPAVLTISGANISSSVFVINSGFVTINGMTIANGLAANGGGISNAGTLTVDYCAFTGNIANGSGGAINSSGTLVVDGVSFSGNTSNAYGGAIYNSGSGPLTITGSTFSGNRSSSDGGAVAGGLITATNSTFSGNSAVDNGGAIYSSGTLTVTNSTFSGNSADNGGAIVTSTGTSTTNNSIFTANYAPAVGGIYNQGTLNGNNNILGGDFGGECGGTGTGCFTNGVNGNQVGVPALSIRLLPLGNYGGTQQTMALLPGSVAICTGLKANAVDAGDSPLIYDERGFLVDAACTSSTNVDVGAVQTNQYVVNSLIDSSDGSDNCNPFGSGTTCSLRDAIYEADGSGGDITFLSSLTSASNPGIINLTPLAGGQGTTLGIGGQMNILGPGANQLSINGDGDYNVGSVLTTNSGALVLYGMTISGGYTQNQSGAGINNDGTLTVIASVISGNQVNYNASGAGIYSVGTLTLLASTVSGNDIIIGSNGSGGGIYSSGTLTLAESTVGGNSVPYSSSGGGGIYSIGSLTLTGSTVSGNTAAQYCPGPINHPSCMGGSGGGILNSGTLTAINSILAGNMAGGTPNSGDCAGSECPSNGNSNVVGGAPELSGPEYNGGGNIVPTMIPQPGSPAICAGLLEYLPSGASTDQRGLPNTNSTYPGYSDEAPCVDAGAVQTGYALSFAAGFLSSYPGGDPMGPTVAVALNENGAPATWVTSPVLMTDLDHVLTGSTSVAPSGGVANFANLIVPAVESSDMLTATLSLNPALTTPLSLTAASQGFQTTVASAVITSPTPGAVLSGSTSFTWSTGTDTTEYVLRVGTAGAGSGNIYYGPYTTNLSVNVSALPTDGETIYVRLWSLVNGAWQWRDYTYTAFTGAPATMTSPVGGTTFTSTTQLFTWSAGTAATDYALRIGSTGPGSSNLYNGSIGTAMSAMVNNLPENTETIYVRLWSYVGGGWQWIDYTYTAFTGAPATISSPTGGTTLSSAAQLFTWNAGVNATEYALRVGTTGAGSGNLYYGPGTTALSTMINNLPINGGTVNVRLWSLVGGVWQFNDYTYTAYTGSAATMSSPTGGTQFGGTSQLFTWNAGSGATEYALWVGSTGVGSSDIYNGAHTASLSTTVSNLPNSPVTVYVRLWSLVGGAWQYVDYTYTGM